MNIVVTSKKPVRTAECGVLPTGIPVEVTDPLGKFLIEQGLAALVETKNNSALATAQVEALTAKPPKKK